MKILVGSHQHETNALTPFATMEADFEILRGRDIFEKLPIMPLLRKAGVKIIPTLYANALPSGKVGEKLFFFVRDEMLAGISKEDPLDGIWLYLHGAMEVENIGKGVVAL